jgi:hypothetical protein
MREVARITEGTQVTTTQPAALDAKESLRQPVWHVVVLCVLTCFAYVFYWFYKNWRDLQAVASSDTEKRQDVQSPAASDRQDAQPSYTRAELERFRDISPPLRALGLILPLINFLFGIALPAGLVIGLGLVFSAGALFLAATLIDGIAAINPSPTSFPRRHPHLATASILMALVASMSLSKLPDPFWLLSLAGSIPLAITQSWLNSYWLSVEPPSSMVRHAFSGKELIAIIIGSLLLGLILAGMMIGVH